MKMHKTIKRTPKGLYILFKSLKQKTNLMTNEKHQTKNDVEVDYGRNSIMPRPHFLFFLLLRTSFSQNLSMLNLGTPSSASLTPVYCKKWPLEPWQLAQAS